MVLDVGSNLLSSSSVDSISASILFLCYPSMNIFYCCNCPSCIFNTFFHKLFVTTIILIMYICVFDYSRLVFILAERLSISLNNFFRVSDLLLNCLTTHVKF